MDNIFISIALSLIICMGMSFGNLWRDSRDRGSWSRLFHKADQPSEWGWFKTRHDITI